VGERVRDAQARKERPVYSGVLRYFPDAIAEVAHVSFVGNRQHNGDTPLRWDRAKSTDEADALARHLLHAGEFDTDGVRHTAKVAWRALALLQKELEAARADADPVRPVVLPGVYVGPAYIEHSYHLDGDAACRDCTATDPHTRASHTGR